MVERGANYLIALLNASRGTVCQTAVAKADGWSFESRIPKIMHIKSL